MNEPKPSCLAKLSGASTEAQILLLSLSGAQSEITRGRAGPRHWARAGIAQHQEQQLGRMKEMPEVRPDFSAQESGRVHMGFSEWLGLSAIPALAALKPVTLLWLPLCGFFPS